MRISCTMDAASAALRQGKPALFPTDTVFGLGVSVLHAEGPQQLFSLKQRMPDKPVAWLVGGVDDLSTYGEDLPGFALDLANSYWPGPLTLIVKAAPCVAPAFQSAAGTIGLRMPDNATVLQLIADVGCPLATTSANLSGQPPAYRFDQIDPALLQQVAAVDDELARSGQASTVVDCTGEAPVILREGSILAQAILRRT